MNCGEIRPYLDGYLDGEVDLVHHVEIEEHLSACDSCSQGFRRQTALRSALRSEELYFNAPAHLERWVRVAARRSQPNPWLARLTRGAWVGAAAAAAAVLAFGVLVGSLFRPSPSDRIAEDVVAGHIRSLMPGHLADVPSTDQHTVKPWFAGKLDFSPAVVDLAGDGFPLIGGRLDYAAHRPVAALVYRRGAHVINLFVWPSSSTAEVAGTASVQQGYNLYHWTRGQTNFWAISDLNATELGQFARLVETGRASVPATDGPSKAP